MATSGVIATGARTLAPLDSRLSDPTVALPNRASVRRTLTLMVLVCPGRLNVSRDGRTVARMPGTLMLAR